MIFADINIALMKSLYARKFYLFFSFSLLCIGIFCQDKDLRSLKMDTTVEKIRASLSEIVINGKKPPISFKVDRQIYTASTFSNAVSGTGADLIKNLPSISVNGQGEIYFRGSQSFLVLINGKPTQGEPSFVLGQLSAASIENIEVITSVSAAFDADGKSGIINIITKVGTENGWMIQSNTMGGAPPFQDFNNRRNPQRYGMDLTAGYRQNKWDVNGGINYLRNDIAGFREGDVFTIINKTKTSFPSMGERSFNRYNYGFRFTAAYQINKLNVISAGFYRGEKYQSRVADILYNNSRKDLLTGATTRFSYFNENDQRKKGIFTLANIDYTHEFINKSKLVFSALYEGADLNGNIYNNNIRSVGSRDTLQYTNNLYVNPLNAYRFKVDYSKKKGTGNFGMGYQYRYDSQQGSFKYLTKILGTNSFLTDPLFSSDVNVSNNIHAIYFQYTGVYGKLNYTTGIRMEQLDRDLSFSKNTTNKKLSLLNIFPNFQIKTGIWEKGILRSGFSRRIKRNNNFELNPFPEREHSETLEQGDSELLPELIGTYELGLENTFLNGTFSASIYHQTILNPIQRVNKVFNDTILNRVYTNAGRATQIGVEANYTHQLTKWWSSILGGNIYQYAIEGKIFNNSVPINNKSWVYSINSTQSFSLPKNWSVQFSVNYLSVRATAQGEDGRFLTPYFSIRKTSTDKQWNFQMQWLNIDLGFDQSNRQRITTFGSNFYTTTNYIYEVNQLQFSVGYNLSKKNRKINLPVSEMGEKEF